jgi:hypothetical protein
MNDPEVEGQYMMLSIKKNVGKKAKGMIFRIEETFIDIGKPKLSSQPKIAWGGETNKGADEIMGEANDPEQRGVGKAKKWLSDYLTGGEKLSVEVYKAAGQAGLSERTVKRAMKQLDVDSFKKTMNSPWFMRLKQIGSNKPDPQRKNHTEPEGNDLEFDF